MPSKQRLLITLLPLGWLMLSPLSLGKSPIATAADYQGQNLDGQRFAATAYSYETGGVYDIQVRFQDRNATLYFLNGGVQTIRLNSAIILNPEQIEGRHRGFLTIGNIFSIGVADDSSGNLQPPRPRPLEGFWQICLKRIAQQQYSCP